MNPKHFQVTLQKNGGIYKRILLDTDLDTTGWLVRSSIFNPEVDADTELAAPTTTLSTYSAGEDNVITLSLDPADLAAQLPTGSQIILAIEVQLDPGLGFFLTIGDGPLILNEGGPA